METHDGAALCGFFRENQSMSTESNHSNRGNRNFTARLGAVLMSALMAVSLLGCAKVEDKLDEIFSGRPTVPDEPMIGWQAIPEGQEASVFMPQEEEVEEEPEEVIEEVVIPDGYYLSELTNEPVSETIREQRPVAIMVDNDERALQHFGTADSDVVYELMNSTANNRVTRLMCLVKDWGKITQFGSVRSVRPTNIILASEWNAVLCHDGGPFYIDEYFNKGYSSHFSGTFSRVNNGKATEFTEYVCTGDLDRNFNNTGVSRNYNGYRPDDTTHFNFVEYGQEYNMDSEGADGSTAATNVALPHPHNNPRLVYNELTGTYDYYEYGSIHQDGAGSRVLSFENVLIQQCDISVYDQNGYMIYNCIQSGKPGYYITNGRCQRITWTKEQETGLTRYYNEAGEEITMNTGKTYITLIPSDVWGNITFN